MGKACALSGHRVIKKDFDRENLKKTIYGIIRSGYDIFYLGMARGFDMEGCRILEKYNEENTLEKVKIIACIPCKDQDRYFSEKEKKEYLECLDKCDEAVYISESYINGCMQIRNRYMIDRCDLLLAYLYKNSGGTFYTVSYAQKKEKEIILV